MLPILYLILMKRNGTPYSEVTVVSLPSSLMIVHSNAFVFSTSLPEVVFRYGFVFKTPIRPSAEEQVCHCFSRTSLNFSYFGAHLRAGTPPRRGSKGVLQNLATGNNNIFQFASPDIRQVTFT